MKTKRFLGPKQNNDKGQFAIEAVLLMTVLVAAFLAVSKYATSKKLLSNLVSGPIKNVSAMTAYGTWRADGCSSPGHSVQSIGKCHPNSISRSLSSRPGPL